MKDEALRLALEALGHFEKAGLATLKTIDAIAAIKQALEQPEPVQQEKDWGAVAEKRLSALKQDAKRRMQDAKRRMEDAAVMAVHKIMQKEPEPVPESTLMALGMKDEALRLALEALLEHGSPFFRHEKQYNHAITASIEALARQCVFGEPNSAGTHRTDGPCLAPQRTWVGLTKKEVHDLFHPEFEVFHQRIEAKLKEKNNG